MQKAVTTPPVAAPVRSPFDDPTAPHDVSEAFRRLQARRRRGLVDSGQLPGDQGYPRESWHDSLLPGSSEPDVPTRSEDRDDPSDDEN